MSGHCHIDLKNKVYLAASFWDYPFGGGEEYINQTMEWTKSQGMQNFWISFADSTNNNYSDFQLIFKENYVSIRIAGGLTSMKLVHWIMLLKPDIMHHQGHHHQIFHEACQATRTAYLTGVHFWNNFIKLDPDTFNVNILANTSKHTIDPVFAKILASKNITVYAVSEFVRDVIQSVCHINLPIVYSGSSEKRCRIDNSSSPCHVTAINIHKQKGGELILHLMRSLREIPFIVIQTEHNSGELDLLIKEEVKIRNEGASITSYYYHRMDNMRYIYQETKILIVPSLVDETFCRTAHEAMMNGIPVITTGAGNLKHLVTEPSCLISANDREKWVERVSEIHSNPDEYHRISKIMENRYQEFSEAECQRRFWNVMEMAMENNKEKNVMIYCPWCDQGLGIQSRNYYHILIKNGYRVSIFSYKPYNGESTISLQKNPDEWQIDGNIYYSPYDREHVKDSELIDFILKNQIGKCIIPETCWNRVFEIAQLMRTNHVKCYAIPNVEIIRRDELNKHRHFHQILCNNHICQNIFTRYGIQNTTYVGYGVHDNSYKPRMKQLIGDTIKFLFIGGMNAFSRKHILEICQAFVIAAESNSNIELTCTIQKINQLETSIFSQLEPYLSHPKIHIIQDHLSYRAIMDLYQSHQVSIQVSKHEGLGLGFYEALMTGTPVITLNTPPHNEIIREGINGWIVNCYTKPMTDNNDGLIESAYFKISLLAEKIMEIASNPEFLSDIYQKLFFDYLENYDCRVFESRFIKAVSS
jgi:glycosyltransferase involved in cell wall biosynthesis